MKLTHETAQQWLLRREDGALSAAQAASLADHLAGCDACRVEADAFADWQKQLDQGLQGRYGAVVSAETRRQQAALKRQLSQPVTNGRSQLPALVVGLTALIALFSLFLRLPTRELSVTTQPVTGAAVVAVATATPTELPLSPTPTLLVETLEPSADSLILPAATEVSSTAVPTERPTTVPTELPTATAPPSPTSAPATATAPPAVTPTFVPTVAPPTPEPTNWYTGSQDGYGAKLSWVRPLLSEPVTRETQIVVNVRYRLPIGVKGRILLTLVGSTGDEPCSDTMKNVGQTEFLTLANTQGSQQFTIVPTELSSDIQWLTISAEIYDEAQPSAAQHQLFGCDDPTLPPNPVR